MNEKSKFRVTGPATMGPGYNSLGHIAGYHVQDEESSSGGFWW